MTSRCLYFGVCIILPLFTLFFMATIFGNGQMENIPIGIVDQDNTASSRAIARNISAVPTFKVTRHFVNEEAARKAVQKHHDERNHQVVGEFQGVSHDAPQRDGQKYFDVPSECFGFRKQKKGKGQKNVDGPFNIGHTTG